MFINSKFTGLSKLFCMFDRFMALINNVLQNKQRKSTIAALVFAGEAIFFLPFVLVRIFRPTLLEVFGISNTELGTYFSVYGVVAMISYIFGGVLADRFPSRNLMILGMLFTSLGGVVMAFIPGTQIMYLLYGFWGFVTIFLFWAAMIRATREWGGVDFQGRAFGLLEGGRGGVAALLGTLSFFVFILFAPEANGESGAASTEAFKIVVLVIAVLTAVGAIFVWFFVPLNSGKISKEPLLVSYKKFLELIRIPTIWMLSLIIICSYAGYKITDYFSLYAREILGFSEAGAAGVGTMALWLRAMVAIFAGYLGDKLNRVKVIQFSFGLTLLTALLTGFGFITHITGLVLLNIALTAVGIYAVRALYFAILEEAKIPLKITGSAVGVVSFLGFTPDIFMSPWMGFLLDKNPGIVGHQNVFLVLSGFALMGFITTTIFRRISKD